MLKKLIIQTEAEAFSNIIKLILSRGLVRLMHKSCKLIKDLNLPISEKDSIILSDIS